jgi:hypothetical protein
MKIVKLLWLGLFFFIYQFGEVCQWLVEDGTIAWHWTFGYISNVGAVLIITHVLYLVKIDTKLGLIYLLLGEALQAFGWYTKISYVLLNEAANSSQLNHFFDWGDIIVLITFWMVYHYIQKRLMKIS